MQNDLIDYIETLNAYEMHKLLTRENKEEVMRQIEILIASQSENQQTACSQR